MQPTRNATTDTADELTIRYTQESITPFWKKLPFFFLFPFRMGPLIFMVCVIGASAVAGLAIGGLGLILKGSLVYLGLRYAFNVLELFAKGRFEGHSPDHSLWGPEKRPAKLGLVIALFIFASITVGNGALESRIAKDPVAQERLVERYKALHAEELAVLRQEQEAYDQRIAQAKVEAERRAKKASESYGEESDDNAIDAMDTADASLDMEEKPAATPSRAEMLQEVKPVFSESLWFKLQPAWYWLLVFLLSLLLPSAAIVIALEDKFFKSLNPIMVVYFMRSIGSAYFALWAFFLLIAGTRQVALSAGAHLPAAVGFPLEMALATYLVLVLFALMGYALYQYHQELHLDVDVDFDNHRQAGGAEAIARAGSTHAAINKVAPMDPLERKIQALIKEGNLKEAIAEVKDSMRYDRLEPTGNTRLHSLYQLSGDPAATLAHGQQWLTALARAQQGPQAVAALQALLTLDPAFVVNDPDVVLPTAQAAMKMREAGLAAKLIKGFDRRFPQHKDLPGIFFLGAKLMSEKMRQHEKAATLLRSLLSRFPDDPIAPEVTAYLSVLDAVAAKAAGRT